MPSTAEVTAEVSPVRSYPELFRVTLRLCECLVRGNVIIYIGVTGLNLHMLDLCDFVIV